MSEISDFAAAKQFARPVNGKIAVRSEIAKFDEPSLHQRSPELDEQPRRASLPSYVQFGSRRDGVWDKLLAKLSTDEREYFDRLSDIVSQAGFKILFYNDNGNAFTPCAKSSIAQQATGGLAPRALRRVRDYIDAHLSEDINVQVLASLAGLSSCYFARAFKQSVGTTPHHYLMERRLGFSKKIKRKSMQSLLSSAGLPDFLLYMGGGSGRGRWNFNVIPGTRARCLGAS
jgi:AraC-like DNA-binding protein